MKEEVKTYTVEDIQKQLGIGRSRAYAFISSVYKSGKPFKVLRIGTLYKIPRKSFDKRLDDNDI